MKKNDIIQSKHVDHIENEKKILEMISHPFIVSIQAFLQGYFDFAIKIRIVNVIDEILWVHAG